MASSSVPMSSRHHSIPRDNLVSLADYPPTHHLSSTAYHGGGGMLHDYDQEISLDHLGPRDDCSNLAYPEPAKQLTPTRPALSTRLLSTLSAAQPAAAALTRKGSVLHSRAKSLAAYVPRLNSSSSSSSSGSTTPTSPERPQQQRHPVFGDLFNGESAPIRIGIPPQSPTQEESELVMEYKPTFTERPNVPRRRSTAVSQAPSTGPATRTGWFGRKSTVSEAAAKPKDELLSLDINQALFPHGPVDPLCPQAFNDLLLNATALLERLQTAYKEKVDYISSIQPEIDAQKEEVEEAETRAQHLKLQLEDMSRRADEQNRTMQEMAMQLAEEKMKLQEAKEQAKNSVRLVRRSTDNSDFEDRNVSPRRMKRASGGSASDSGFESDVDYAESVMSGGVDTPLSPPRMILTPAYGGQEWASSSGMYVERPVYSRGSTASGVSQNWNHTVEHLRGENSALRRQVEDMRLTLQSCIDFVASVQPP